MAAAKEAAEVTEAAEVAMAVVEVHLTEADAEVGGMAAADMVALLLLMEVVVMAVLLHAQGEFLDIVSCKTFANNIYSYRGGFRGRGRGYAPY